MDYSQANKRIDGLLTDDAAWQNNILTTSEQHADLPSGFWSIISCWCCCRCSYRHAHYCFLFINMSSKKKKKNTGCAGYEKKKQKQKQKTGSLMEHLYNLPSSFIFQFSRFSTCMASQKHLAHLWNRWKKKIHNCKFLNQRCIFNVSFRKEIVIN